MTSTIMSPPLLQTTTTIRKRCSPQEWQILSHNQIPCACGCGELINEFDDWRHHRRRRYANGHHRRGKQGKGQKGNTNAKGSIRSEKHKQILREHKLAKKETDVTKVKKSLSHAGIKESEDTKDKKKIKRIKYWRKKNGFAST
jgi:hypothetical protein